MYFLMNDKYLYELQRFRTLNTASALHLFVLLISTLKSSKTFEKYILKFTCLIFSEKHIVPEMIFYKSFILFH